MISQFYSCKPNHDLELILHLYALRQQTDIDVGTQGESQRYLKNTVIGINIYPPRPPSKNMEMRQVSNLFVP